MNFKDFALNIAGAVLLMAMAAVLGGVFGFCFAVAAMAFRFWN